LPSPTSQQNPGLLYALFHESFTHIHCAKYPAANGEAIELVALVDEKGAFFLESSRNVAARLRVGSDRHGIGRSSNDKLRDHRISGDRNSIAYDGVLVIFG
jgi:hypothetical protein